MLSITLRKGKQAAIVCILFFAEYNLHAQYTPVNDSLFNINKVYYHPKKITGKSFIVPVGLIAVGALGTSGDFIISNPEIKEERDEHFATFHTSVDNYLQYAPIVAGYAMLINNPQHSFWNYTTKVVLTEVIMNGLVYSTKNITKVPRPDTGAPTSFPSGHTAQAFAGATLFCDEFAQHNTLLCVGVYSTAAAVGALRIMNNRHWASDVIAGAGFGMLSAKLSEWIVGPPHSKHKHAALPSNF
ncbi:MAG TPA: phosphatase PAP2 family protein [Parafilimonas sp.]|nr:phosphatase PAP2 family protein [Parafilimonas sp.]